MSPSVSCDASHLKSKFSLRLFASDNREQLANQLNPNAKTLLDEISRQSETIPVDVLSFLPSATVSSVQRDKRLTVIDSIKEYKAPERVQKVYTLQHRNQSQAPIAA